MTTRVRIRKGRDTVVQPPEQVLYARLLEAGARLGLAVLVLTFVGYAFGLLDAHIAPERLPEVWSLPVGRYLEQTQQSPGWHSLLQLRFGDVASLWGIVILSTCSVACLLALVPGYWRRRDWTYVLLCLAEVAVIGLAASGWLAGGH